MAESRRFRAGSRRGSNPEQFSENRIAWLRTVMGQMVLFRYQSGSEGETIKEDGDSYVLVIPKPGGRPVNLNLTALTAEELNKLEEFFNLAINLARPVVIQRDRVAEDAASRGDDSFVRSYRQLPQFIVRKGSLGEHQAGVHDGPEDLPAGPGGVGDRAGHAGRVGDELAHTESAHSGTEDDTQEDHEPS